MAKKDLRLLCSLNCNTSFMTRLDVVDPEHNFIIIVGFRTSPPFFLPSAFTSIILVYSVIFFTRIATITAIYFISNCKT